MSQANICVLGSISTGQSVARNLYKAGARKISLINVDVSLSADESSNQLSAPRENETSEPFAQIIETEWTIANIENFVQNAGIVIDTLSDWQKKLTLSDICMEAVTVLIHSGITGFRFQLLYYDSR